MKLAVVPVSNGDTEILVNGIGINSTYGQYIPVEQCKLTKEQVEVMAAYVDPYAFMPMSVHCSKKTKNGMMDAAREKVKNMVRMIGIEVE